MSIICGRYYLNISIDKLLEKYGILDDDISFAPSNEIFPSQKAPVVLNGGRNKEIELFKWGFSPSYLSNLIINARSETLDQKKTFKKPFKNKRCLIPANGFFEWKKQGNKKVKHRIYLEDQAIFTFAGLYDTYKNDSGEDVKSFTIITTQANKEVSEIHNRMPVILHDQNIEDWLDPSNKDTDRLKDLLQPYDEGRLIVEPMLDNKQQMSLDF